MSVVLSGIRFTEKGDQIIAEHVMDYEPLDFIPAPLKSISKKEFEDMHPNLDENKNEII